MSSWPSCPHLGSGVGTVGGGGKRVSSLALTSIIAESSMWTGFRWSIDISSCLPLTSTVKVLAPSLTSLWQLWYGCCRVRRTASCCMGAMREIATHERFLSCVMMGWSSSQLRHCFLQPSYVSNLIYGVAAVEEFGRKVQGSAVYQFRSTAM